jgi:hypothetical protein
MGNSPSTSPYPERTLEENVYYDPYMWSMDICLEEQFEGLSLGSNNQGYYRDTPTGRETVTTRPLFGDRDEYKKKTSLFQPKYSCVKYEKQYHFYALVTSKTEKGLDLFPSDKFFDGLFFRDLSDSLINVELRTDEKSNTQYLMLELKLYEHKFVFSKVWYNEHNFRVRVELIELKSSKGEISDYAQRRNKTRNEIVQMLEAIGRMPKGARVSDHYYDKDSQSGGFYPDDETIDKYLKKWERRKNDLFRVGGERGAFVRDPIDDKLIRHRGKQYQFYNDLSKHLRRTPIYRHENGAVLYEQEGGIFAFLCPNCPSGKWKYWTIFGGCGCW